ncbi:TPA: hypothetical protein ACPJ1T_004191 [Vibrio diabolicus]|uniref:hypothetical protein n=1 Tax=Vibrio TaxID=662 RepID=UPI000DF2B9BC|nr:MULTISPECIES: hypothetical protein [Vibrio]MEA3482167.1 hypothetical protein [Pseudomonadota bacterium]MCG9232273.1 hypothetical protein [Vibrio diabolicus]MCG9574178.1 hypothetical protein [Vibrio diabolicus]MCG9591448.1 hypothetical protein [Vibrio diabolicus]MCG9622427.1 hypothetical protein [Vibrio diabolicus]
MFRLRHGHFLRQRENIDIEIDDNEYQLHYQAYKLLKTNKVRMISKLLEEVEQREEKRQNSPEELGC